MKTDKISSLVEKRVVGSERGTLFFLSDFADIGGSEATRKALQRLCNAGVLQRCARGMYLYPKIDDVFGFGVVPASDVDIARAYANHRGIGLYATEVAALNLLGLSDQNQMRSVYLTDGPSFTIKTDSGEIAFIHTSDSNLDKYKSNEMRLLNLALSGYGNVVLSEDVKRKIQMILFNVGKENVLNDIKLMKTWKRNMILSLQQEIS